jgi:outer membrane protein TolC
MKVKFPVFAWTMIVAISLLIGAMPSRAQEGAGEEVRTLDLDECVAIAMEQNPDAIIGLRSVQSARAGILGAVANFLPQLSVSSSYSHSAQSFRDPLSGITVDGVEIPERYLERTSDSYSAGLNLSQSIFRGGYNLSSLA